ncbi:MAG: hypothetical protein V4549_11340, partial [Bacteroidota bacterium]
ERNNGDGWWIYLEPPFFNSEMESRIIHEQKLSDCIKILKGVVNTNDIKQAIRIRFGPIKNTLSKFRFKI